MSREVFLIHWHQQEAAELAKELRSHGFSTRVEHEDGGKAVRGILANPPDAIVVSLRRLPSHGRETIRYLREQPNGAGIPILFLEGDPEKVKSVQKAIPEGIFADYSGWIRALRELLGEG